MSSPFKNAGRACESIVPRKGRGDRRRRPQRLWRFGCYSGGGFTGVTTCDGNGVTVRSVVRGSRLVAFVSAWSDSIACFRFWEDGSFAKPLFASLNEVLPSRFLAHPSAKAAATNTNEIGSLRMTISEDCSSRVAKSCRVTPLGALLQCFHLSWQRAVKLCDGNSEANLMQRE